MSLKELLDAKENWVDYWTNELYNKCEAVKKDIIAGKDVEQNLREYESLMSTAHEHFKLKYSKKLDAKITNAYKLYEKMSYELKDELNAEVNDGVITYAWPGKTLSYAVRLIASLYNLHCGMFTFNSGFTSHEAYTEDDYLLHIGISDDHNHVVIDFHFDKLLEKWNERKDYNNYF